MKTLGTMLDPRSYLRYARRKLRGREVDANPSLRGEDLYAPGHFYSPMLDLKKLGRNDSQMPDDGLEAWEHIDLRREQQRSYYQDLLENFAGPPFPGKPGPGHRYFSENKWFALSDAFTLAAVLRKEKPRRIVEVGSGFSSAVMLDTLEPTRGSAALTFIDPYPERLYSLLSPEDRTVSAVLVQPVQEVALSVFDELEAQDVLFIDSSHVAKIGSDVTYIFLRILPRLKRGVIVHFHDIFYPYSYPVAWLREGRAWNETLFLRVLLLGGSQFRIMAFNSFAGHSFPKVFKERLPDFLKDTGGSIWMQKTA